MDTSNAKVRPDFASSLGRNPRDYANDRAGRLHLLGASSNIRVALVPYTTAALDRKAAAKKIASITPSSEEYSENSEGIFKGLLAVLAVLFVMYDL